MPGQEVTRASLQRALAVNALTKPVNVVVPAGVVVGALLIGAGWLLAVAVVVYAVLAAMTFFDAEEAERVGQRAYARLNPGAERVDPGRLAAPIASRLSGALEAETRIRRAIAAAELPFVEVGAEVGALVDAVGRTARRAQLVHDYMASQNPRQVSERIEQLSRLPASSDPSVAQTVAALREQLRAQQEMSRQLERFYAEMEQTVAALNTIHAEIVRMGVTSGRAEEQELAGRLRDLHEQVDALSQGMTEAYAAGDGQTSGRGSIV